MYRILLTPNAQEDLHWFRSADQKLIVDALKEQLTYEPLSVTRNRKPLRSNPLAPWVVRIGKYRAFYDVDPDEATVTIRAIGHKEHNELHLRGRRVAL